MYKQHHNRVYKRFVLIFLSFGTINSFNCNKSETVIMIREKKTHFQNPRQYPLSIN